MVGFLDIKANVTEKANITEKKVDTMKEIEQHVNETSSSGEVKTLTMPQQIQSQGFLTPKPKDDAGESDTTIVGEKGEFLRLSIRNEKKLEIKATKISELTGREGVKVLVFGQPKTGKTSFLLSAPEPIFIIDTEDGIRPLKSLFGTKNVTIFDVMVGDEKSFEIDEESTIELIRLTLGNIRNECIKYHNETGKYATIGIDSMSKIWDVMLMWLNVEVMKAGGKINKKDVPSDRRDWKKLNSFESMIMWQLMKLPANVVIIAQSKEAFEDDANDILKSSGEAPRVWKNIKYEVDMVLKTYVDRSSNRFYAQVWDSRYKEFKTGEMIESPKIQTIIDRIAKK